jgi:hypothetical protein
LTCENSAGEKLNIDPRALPGTWFCHFDTCDAATMGTSTTDNNDGPFSGFADMRISIPGKSGIALLKVFSKGKWALQPQT